MLAGRVLPPILQAPQDRSLLADAGPPLATFFNIPRRYVRSSMQVNAHSEPWRLPATKSSESSTEMPRKTSRVRELRAAAGTSPIERTKEQRMLSASQLTTDPRVGKKRHASFDDEVDASTLADAPNASPRHCSPRSSLEGSLQSPGALCSCQPEAKIPRPRNAFILYRQHHQQALVAQHPGLPNPDISKIIGEQWNSETEKAKKIWQDLAQEEKLRHHEQFPDYRYRPRRASKLDSGSVDTSHEHSNIEHLRCPRCGRISIIAPESRLHHPDGLATLPRPDNSGAFTTTTRYLPLMSNTMQSPVRHRMPMHGPLPSSHPRTTMTPISAREDASPYSPMTPGLKRRRVQELSMPNGMMRRPDGPSLSQARREALPRIDMRRSPHSATVPALRTPQGPRRGSDEISLKVATSNDQSRSVEAMVMSAAPPSKIKVLGKITPPLQMPGPTSPAIAVRGAIIAVEGDDLGAIQKLTHWLHNHLDIPQEFVPRIAEPPKEPSQTNGDVKIEDYLDLIKEWHGRSKEMVEYVTTPVTPPPSSTLSSSSDHEVAMKDVADRSASVAVRTPPHSPGKASAVKPVLLLPTYQLHAADVYASRIPIQDVYSPMDHWTWMATLWRGTVGPDLTIYVKGEEKEGSKDGKDPRDTKEVNDAKDVKKGVVVMEETKCMIVALEGDGTFSEKTLRRVGFEVGEWIRGIGVGSPQV